MHSSFPWEEEIFPEAEQASLAVLWAEPCHVWCWLVPPPGRLCARQASRSAQNALSNLDFALGSCWRPLSPDNFCVLHQQPGKPHSLEPEQSPCSPLASQTAFDSFPCLSACRNAHWLCPRRQKQGMWDRLICSFPPCAAHQELGRAAQCVGALCCSLASITAAARACHAPVREHHLF